MAKKQQLILVDTSVWASFFNNADLPAVRYLDRVLESEEGDLAVMPIILTEVLQGFRSDSGFRSAKSMLRRLPMLMLDIDSHVKAASMFRRLRKSGVTIRGAVDCLIAQACIEHGAMLLTLDGDFARIADHSPLKLVSY
jgi:predicted nucleic acid-binding protein